MKKKKKLHAHMVKKNKVFLTKVKFFKIFGGAKS